MPHTDQSAASLTMRRHHPGWICRHCRATQFFQCVSGESFQWSLFPNKLGHGALLLQLLLPLLVLLPCFGRHLLQLFLHPAGCERHEALLHSRLGLAQYRLRLLDGRSRQQPMKQWQMTWFAASASSCGSAVLDSHAAQLACRCTCYSTTNDAPMYTSMDSSQIARSALWCVACSQAQLACSWSALACRRSSWAAWRSWPLLLFLSRSVLQSCLACAGSTGRHGRTQHSQC